MTTRCMAWLASESSSTSARWSRIAALQSSSMARVASSSTARSRFFEGSVRFLRVEGDDTWVSDGTLLVTTFAPGEKGLARPTARLGSGTGTERAEDVLGIVVRTGSQLRCVIDVT
jgi:hypothetical protein